MKANLKFWTVLLCAGLALVGCCDDPITPEVPDTGDDDNPPVEQPEVPDDEKPDNENPDNSSEKPLTDGSLCTMQLNDDIMAIVGTGDWNAITYGNGKYVAVGDNGNIAYSTDGNSWTLKTVGSTNFYGDKTTWNLVVYGSNIFVAIGMLEDSSTGKNSYIAYSSDGIDWSVKLTWKGSDFSNTQWDSVCFGNGKFVVLGSDNISNKRIAYSTNGIDWTTIRMSNFDDGACDICYGSGKFVVAGLLEMFYSTDAINYATVHVDPPRLDSSTAIWRSTCYANGKFFAYYPRTAGSGPFIASSINGVDWEIQNFEINVRVNDIHHVEYYNDIFVGIIPDPDSGYRSFIIMSFDGIYWKVVYTLDSAIYNAEPCMTIVR